MGSKLRRFLSTLCVLLGAASHHPARAEWHGGAAGATPTEMDAYIGSFYGLCATKRVASTYGGPLFQLRRPTDQATMDVYPLASGWPDVDTITTWANGATIFVPKCYDQTGNGRTMAQATLNNQPILNLKGNHPAIHFDGYFQSYSPMTPYLPIVSGIAGFTGLSVAANGTANTKEGQGIYSVDAVGSTRSIMTLGNFPPTTTELCAAGRVPSDGFSKTSGLVFDTAWHVQTCRVDFISRILQQQRDNLVSIRTPPVTGAGITAGVTPIGSASGVWIGSYRAAFMWFGDLTLVGFTQSSMPDAVVAAWTNTLQAMVPTFPVDRSFFRWGNFPKQSTNIANVIPGLVGQDKILLLPNGQTPVVTDLETYQYRHATMIAYHHGRRWVAYFTNRNSETDGGLSVAVTSSIDAWATHTPLEFAVPPQSDWLPDGVLHPTDTTTRGVVNRNFYVYQDRLFLLSTIDQTNPPKELATIATEMFDDGSVGEPFITSDFGYTSNVGYPQYSYDPVLGPPLRRAGNVWGQYGNGAIDNSDPDPGWWTINGQGFCERGPVPMDKTGLHIIYIYRVCQFENGGYPYIGETFDGDVTESRPLLQTTIPASGSPTSGALLPDGRIVTVGNPFPNRGSQYIATWNKDGSLQTLHATVAQNALPPPYVSPSGAQLFGGSGKGGNCSYPGLWVDEEEGLLLISCSQAKESVIVMSVPLANL